MVITGLMGLLGKNNMNILNIDNKDCTLENFVGKLIINYNCNLFVKGSCDVLIIDNKSDLNITLDNDAFLTITFFSNNKKIGNKINVTQNNNSSIKLADVFTNEKEINETITCNVNGKNNKANIIINGILNFDANIDASINVLNTSKNNELLEDIKVYENGGIATVKPDLLVYTSDVSANHKCVLTNLNNEDDFYLSSKGLDKNECEKLIKTGFMLKEISNEFKDKIRKEYYE